MSNTMKTKPLSQHSIDRKEKKKLLNSSGVSDNPFYGRTEKSYLEDRVKDALVFLDPALQERYKDSSMDIREKARELGINISRHK